MDVTPFFVAMAQTNGSDLYFITGVPVHIKISGIIKYLNEEPLNSYHMAAIVSSLLTNKQQKEFDQCLELNIAIVLEGVGRFRINVFRQRGELALVARYVKSSIPAFETLGLPAVLKTLIMELRGLIIVTGSAASGKSTTLAAMIDHRNTHSAHHIITIEDPIEFIYQHKKSVIVQREIGVDTHSYDNALKNAMREGPDVISIGEIRDLETMRHALTYAQTGHLCLSTLHASNANETFERIISFFPKINQSQILLELSLSLKAIISLRLLNDLSNKRIPAVEILINSPYMSELIKKEKFDEMKELMSRSHNQGMQTFDRALINLYKENKISAEDAIYYADSKNDVSLQIRLG